MGRNGRRIIETQHFTVRDDRCAMKVGTDALLLGSWANPTGRNSIVDIGTGSGILLMMLAQRASPGTRLVGLELHDAACEQARININQSPFDAEIIHCDALAWLSESARRGERFDLFVCNPPFFRNKPLGPDEARNLARHDASMPIEGLLAAVRKVMNEQGSFCMVWPDDRMAELAQEVRKAGLIIAEDCQIQGHPESRPLRHLLIIQVPGDRSPETTHCTSLIVENSPRTPGGAPQYSDAYKTLLSPYFPGLSISG